MTEQTGDGGARIYLGLELLEECPGPFDFGEVAVHSSRSPAKRSPNEDAAAVLPLERARAVLAVADGVGGLPGGKDASERALEALSRALREASGGGTSLREAILSGFDRANRAVMDLGVGGATTLAVVEIDGRQMRTYHVGDSAVLAFGGDGKLKLQTIAHSPVGYAVEAGILDEEDAMVHEDRHLVSNVIGDPHMHLGLSSALELCDRDTVVIGSDGLFDNMQTEEVVERLRRGSLRRALHELATECRTRMAGGGHPDDLTVIAFRPPRTRRGNGG